MPTERAPLLPHVSFEVPASAAAANAVPARLAAFADEHGVGEPVRRRLAAVTAEAVAALAAGPTGPRPDPIRVEADVDEHELQVVITRDVGSSEAAATLRSRVAAIRARPDGFSTERAGVSGVEIWICFRLEGAARPSAA